MNHESFSHTLKRASGLCRGWVLGTFSTLKSGMSPIILTVGANVPIHLRFMNDNITEETPEKLQMSPYFSMVWVNSPHFSKALAEHWSKYHCPMNMVNGNEVTAYTSCETLLFNPCATPDGPDGQIDGLMQERRNSIANTLELRLSCTNPSRWPWHCTSTV